MTSLFLLEKCLLIRTHAGRLRRPLIFFTIRFLSKAVHIPFERVEPQDYASARTLARACKIAENRIG